MHSALVSVAAARRISVGALIEAEMQHIKRAVEGLMKEPRNAA